MAVWPFRRRSGRKRSRGGAALSDTEGPVNSTTASKKKRRTEPAKPNGPTRTYSFSPGRRDSIRVDRERGKSPTRRRNVQNTNGASTFNDECGLRGRPPTLHHKQKREDESHNRKLTKKKPKDRGREAEIKAMSQFAPARPAAEEWTSGRPMKRDSKRAGRTSDVSLPVAGSIHSSLSADSDLGSYKVSKLDALAPRPTLRYAQGRSTPSPPPRTASQRKRLLEQEPIPAATMRAHKRIDSLADNLDAHELRELMDRDRRRREKRRQKEKDRIERRLAEQAEKQRAEEEAARTMGTPPPENLERGVMGREMAGLGIEPASAIVTSSSPREPDDTDMVDAEPGDSEPKKPLEAFHRTDTIPMEEESVPEQDSHQDPAQDSETPVSPVDEKPPSVSSNKMSGLLKLVRTRSRSTLASERGKMVSPPPDTINEEPTRQNSNESLNSAKPPRFGIRALLKRARSRKNSTPSSFSNTSREEMQAAIAAAKTAQAQAEVLARLQGENAPNTSAANTGNYLARKPSFGVPKRTRSRFREDLPELPLTPPASRMQSPEVEPPMPVLEEHKSGELGSNHSPNLRYDTPTSMDRAKVTPSPDAGMSMSMASVDSEGSWFSGKANTRRAAMLESIRRVNQRELGHSIPDSLDDADEDLTITEDEYLSKLTPRRYSGHHMMGRRSGEGRPSSDEDEFLDDAKWVALPVQPRYVHRDTLQSSKALVYMEESDHELGSSPVSPTSQEDIDIQRATSVKLSKGHARNFSAGSAKLLDLTPRGSLDERRSSSKRASSEVIEA